MSFFTAHSGHVFVQPLRLAFPIDAVGNMRFVLTEAFLQSIVCLFSVLKTLLYSFVVEFQ